MNPFQSSGRIPSPLIFYSFIYAFTANERISCIDRRVGARRVTDSKKARFTNCRICAMGRKKNSNIREFFIYHPDTKKSTCKKCSVDISGNYVSNLRRHIESAHKVAYAELIAAEHQETENEGPTPAKKTRKFWYESSEEDITSWCVDLVTKHGILYATLDYKAFRNIIEPIYKGLDMSIINSHNVQGLIADRAHTVRTDIENLCRGKLISIKLDLATRLNRSVLGVNVQLVKGGEIIIKTLAMLEIFERHTADAIKNKICKILEQYKINLDQIYSLTTDNGSNLVKAADLLQKEGNSDNIEMETIDEADEFLNEMMDERLSELSVASVEMIRCAAHTLQLVVHDVLRKDGEIETVLAQARNLCKTLRTPSLTLLISHLGFKKPVLDVPTRWNSTITMLEILSEYKDYCQENEAYNDKLAMSEETWKDIQEIIVAFSRLKDTTTKLQNSQLALGDFVKLYLSLKLQMEKKTGPLAAKILAAMKKREDRLLNTTSATTATFLDPRIFRILNAEQKEAAKAHMRKLITRILHAKASSRSSVVNSSMSSVPSSAYSANVSPFSSFSSTVSDQPLLSTPASAADRPSTSGGSSMDLPITRSDDLLANYLDELANDEEQDESFVNSPNDAELRLALAEVDEFKPSIMPLDTNVLEYWEKKKYQLPYVSQCANVVHGVPATQVSVERSFSTLKFILSDNRYNLTSANLENILLVKLN